MACRCCPGGISRSTRMPRYPPDMSDAEWAVTEPALPGPAWKQGRAGPPAGNCRRDIAGAIRYLVKEGICWRAMPANFSPWQTVYAVLDHWQDSGAPKRCTANCAASAGSRPAWAKKALKLTVQIVWRPDDLHTSHVLPCRWVVERTLAWITRCRRTVRDCERLTEHHETIVYWAMIITMSRRL